MTFRDEEVSARLAGLLRGNQKDAAWLYDTFAPRLHRRLRQRYPQLDADDLLQDAFVFYFQNRAKVLREYSDRAAGVDETGLERRLWDLACGLASNRRRSIARRAWAKIVPLTSVKVPLGPASERRTIGRDLLRRLEDCLRESGRRRFLYYKLRFRDGLKAEEISRATGWPRPLTYRLRRSLNGAVRACAQRLGLSDQPSPRQPPGSPDESSP